MFSLFRHLFSGPRPSPRRCQTFRPRFDDLENRCLLSANTFAQTNLVSDVPGLAQFTNPLLVNPWGIVASATSPFWVSDNGTGLSTVYNGDGTEARPPVTVPPPGNSSGTAAPTGIVVNGNRNEFTVQANGTSGGSIFIFATEDGTISGWSPGVDPNNAILAVDNSASRAVYKGLALGTNSQGDFLYATNFRSGQVDVFDSNFQPAQLDGSFTDPNLPAGYAPFGISNINGQLYVTYAKQNGHKHDDRAGVGRGFVDVFDTDGHFMQRLISRGQLDSPWGLAVAPAGFGKFGGDLLVGNFGNGTINAYDLTTGDFQGTLHNADRQPIVIDGLWGLSFGNGQASDANTLYFTAGINHESDGLFGSIQSTSNHDSADPGIGIALGTAGTRSVTIVAVSAPGQHHTQVHPGMTGDSLGQGSIVSGNPVSTSLHAHGALSPVSLDSLFALDLASNV